MSDIWERIQSRCNDSIEGSDELFRQTLQQSLDKISRNINRFGNSFPYVGRGKEYELTNNSTWVSGYWTASLWMAYLQTGDPAFKEAAERHYEGYNMRFHQPYIHCHDVGVIYDLAAVRGYAVTGDVKWKHLAIRAAAFLTTRFHEKSQFLQAWGLPGETNANTGRTIIDSLCCIPLWYWASQETGDKRYAELATQQANTVRKRLVRDDHSSGHSFLFDADTEKPIGIRTFQGKSDDSTWSRGQAWGIQGFFNVYAYTKDPTFLNTAFQMLEWYVDHTDDSFVPPWDFSAPEEERDTSALTLVVNGLLRYASMDHISETERESCLSLAKHATVQLIHSYGTFEDEASWGLLREGVYGKPQGRGISEFMIWGDYYFIENLMMLVGKHHPLKLSFH